MENLKEMKPAQKESAQKQPKQEEKNDEDSIASSRVDNGSHCPSKLGYDSNGTCVIIPREKENLKKRKPAQKESAKKNRNKRKKTMTTVLLLVG